MKLSLCSIGDREADIETVIAGTSSLGYLGIELYEHHIARYIERGNAIGQLSELLDKHGLSVSVLSSYATFLGSDEIFGKTISHFGETVLPWAKSLHGAPVRILIDWIGSERASAEERLRMVSGLRELARLAASERIVILMETHADQLTDSTEATIRFIEDVGMNNVKVNLDIFNLFHFGENPLDALERLYPYTTNVHLKNGSVVGNQATYGKLLSEGDMDFLPFLRELGRRKYDGFMGIEWFGDRFWEAAESEIGWLRSALRDTNDS